MGCCFCLGQPSLTLQHLFHLPLLSPLVINQEVYAPHPPTLLGSLRFQTPPDWSSFQTLFILWLSLVLSSWDDAGFSSSSESEVLHECINSVEPRGPPASFSVFIMEMWLLMRRKRRRQSCRWGNNATSAFLWLTHQICDVFSGSFVCLSADWLMFCSLASINFMRKRRTQTPKDLHMQRWNFFGDQVNYDSALTFKSKQNYNMKEITLKVKMHSISFNIITYISSKTQK